MFARTLQVTFQADPSAPDIPVPLAWLDSFAMRNFTNSAEFDDLLPVADGRLEAGYRVPLPELAAALELWLRRKRRLPPPAQLSVRELPRSPVETDPQGRAS